MSKFWISAFLLLVSTVSFCQSKTFVEAQLNDVLQWIEVNSNYSFNYDSGNVSMTPFSGNIDLQDPEKAIEKLFYSTRYDIDKSSSVVLIFPPVKNNYKISGTLTDAEGSPLPYANILLVDNPAGTQTDENGKYSLSVEAYKNDRIIISYLGYESIEKMIQELPMEYSPKMKISENLLGETVTIRDYLIEGITDDSNYASTQIDIKKVNESEHSSQVDVFNSVLLLPGIHSTDESSTNLNIRGSRQDQNLIVWENATLYDPGHIYGMVSSINPFTIDDITIYKNSCHPSFENRLGGVMDISLSDVLPPKPSFGIGTTLTETHAYLNTPLFSDRIGLILSGRKDIASLIKSPTVDSYMEKIFRERGPEFLKDDKVDKQEFGYSDLNAKLIYNLSDQLQFHSSFFYTDNDYQLTNFLSRGENEIRNTNNTLRNSSAFNTEITYRPHPANMVKIYYSRSTFDNQSMIRIREERRNEKIRDTDIDNNILDTKIGIEQQIRKRLTYSWGYTYEMKEVGFIRDQKSDLEGNKNDFRTDTGMFHNFYANVNLGNKRYSLDLGNRSTYYIQEKKLRHTPRLSFKYQLGQKWSINSTAGLFNQYISQLEDFRNSEINSGNQVWILTYEVIQEVQQAKKFSLGFNYNGPTLLFDVDAYYNHSTGISTLNNGELREDVGLANRGEATIIGVDLLLKKNFGKYSSWLNYTLSKNEYSFKRISPEPFPSNIDQRHNLSWVHQFSHGPWSANFTFNYKTGLPYSIPIGIEEEGGPGNKIFRPEYGKLNTEKLHDYFRSDLSIQRKIKFNENGLRGDIVFYMLNIFDKENLYSRDFFLTDPSGDRMMPMPYRIDKLLLRRTPQLLVRIHY